MSPRKKSTAEDGTRRVLQVLRAAADKSTVRQLSGRRVATIVPPFPDGGRSYIKYVAGVTGMPPGTVGIYIGALVRAGLMEGGEGFGLRKRWVVLDGEYNFPHS